MLFNSPTFLFLFLPATLAACILARRLAGARAVLGVLVSASVFFYGWWNPLYLPLLGGLAVFNFMVARKMTAARQEERWQWVRLLLTFGVTVDLSTLAYFKYTDFFIGTADGLFGAGIAFRDIVLPLGISFFTFQKIAYLVDASRGEVGEHDFLEYCFFVMFFPQLIAGPIVHHREIFSQLRHPDALLVQPNHVGVGMTIFMIGLFKKVVIADHLSPVVAGVFNAAHGGAPVSAFHAWQGVAAYSLQLYFDFSGYSDMAIGGARLFGIRLPINFNSPYQATGIIEFWQRWHVTLSRFLRDYLYIPLGGNRKGLPRRYVNLMLTMTIGGLWHGAWWTFVLWGFLHGVYLCINHGWRAVWTPLDRWWSRTVARSVTILAVVIAFVLFRSPDLMTALRLYCDMFGLPPPAPTKALPQVALAQLGAALGGDDTAYIRHTIYWGLLLLAVLWFAPNTQQLLARVRPAFNYSLTTWRRDPPLLRPLVERASLLLWRPNLIGAMYIGLLTGIALLNLQHVSEFLYFEF
jgi:alginate O-acetyltransferase complex protein AlgI